MRRLLCLIAASFGFATAPLVARAAPEAEAGLCEVCEVALDLALSNPRRKDDAARDAYRHPDETLAFFRVRPGMTVVDYLPAGGWYTRILVPYLGESGQYIALNPDVSDGSESQRKSMGNLAGTFPEKAAGWTGVPAAGILAYNSDGLPEKRMGTVDRALIFREVHNLVRYGWFGGELDRLHTLLKPDGMLGIVEHRAKPDAPDAYVDGSKGYMREADVIKTVEAHGFELVGNSQINANPKDPADWPKGVWTLPPSLSQGDADRDRYLGIGESDRMTLLFRKRG